MAGKDSAKLRDDDIIDVEVKPLPEVAEVVHPRTLVIDPLEINVRLYKQISELLRQLEDGDVDIKVRYMALMAIARMQAVFVALRKEKFDEPNRGSAVRKYATAFKTNVPRRRKVAAGSAAPEPEPDFSLDDIIGNGDDEPDI